jgi:hypothetical protein
MSESFKASAQYDDLTGTAAFDGHDGPPLRDMQKYCKIAPGYLPVGFKFGSLAPDKDGMVSLTIVAVRCDQAGDNIDAVVRYAQAHNGELTVYPFSGKMPMKEWERFFKRTRINAAIRHLETFELQVDYDNVPAVDEE